MFLPTRPTNRTVVTSIINKRWHQVNPPMQWSRPLLINICQHTVDESTIVNKGRAWKMPSCICSCQLCIKWEVCCSDSWKLWLVDGEAHNMTENALSILIIFSVRLQQTKISQRKPFLFQHSRLPRKRSILFAYYFIVVCILWQLTLSPEE